MKKMMLMLAMVFSLTTTFAFTGEEAVNKQAVSNFKTQFRTAADANWTTGKNYYKVEFNEDNQKLFAYYNFQGDFVAVCRYISSLSLPFNLQNSLRKDYSGAWITDLFEMASKEGTSYYVTLENADSKIVLSSTDGSSWSVFERTRKA
jgi:hypothetical protein